MRLRIRYHEGFPGKSLKSRNPPNPRSGILINFLELFFSLQIFMVQNVFCLSCAHAKLRGGGDVGPRPGRRFQLYKRKYFVDIRR
jgi:hypothetical protein